MQFQADILGRTIVRPKMIDTTAKGAALLAGVTSGLWNDKKDLQKLQKVNNIFLPHFSASKTKDLYWGWKKALRQAQTK